ncbi:hypothetical protein IWX49DRAFT_553776 [Phyllosticta citricarpa]
MDEAFQSLTTISDHLTKALSSSDSQLDFSKAWEGLCATEDSESHKTIATRHIIDLLRHFLTSANSTPSRCYAGIITARLCHRSIDIAGTFSRIPRRDQRYNLVYGLGNLILEEGVREDLRLICGLIIRSCVHHGVDRRIFWPRNEVHASFPIDDGQQWVNQFYGFIRADDGLKAERISESEETTHRFTQAGVATAALLGIGDGRRTECFHIPRRVSTTEALDVSIPLSPSSAPSPPRQHSTTMSGATGKLARMRKRKQLQHPAAMTLPENNAPRNLPKATTHKQNVFGFGSSEAASHNQSAGQEDHERAQRGRITGLKNNAGDLKRPEAIHHELPVPEKKRGKSEEGMGKRPSPRSKVNASNLARAEIYDLPQDGDDDFDLDATVTEAPKKRGPRRARKEPHGISKKPSQSSRKPKAPETFVSDEQEQKSGHDSAEDSDDADYQAKPTRGEDSQGHGERRSQRLAAARSRGSSEAREKASEKHDPNHTVDEKPGPVDAQQENPVPAQHGPLTTNSHLDSHPQKSSSPGNRQSNSSSDKTEPLSRNEARKKLDVESQRSETYEEFEDAVITRANEEEAESLKTKPEKTTTAGPQSEAVSENAKQAKGPDNIERERTLPPESALLASSTTDGIDFPLFGSTAEPSSRVEHSAVATRFLEEMDREVSKTKTKQPDDTRSEAAKEANVGDASQPNPSRDMLAKMKTAISSSSQPDPSRSVFTRIPPVLEQNTQVEPSRDSSAKEVLEDVGVSNNEEIETRPENEDRVVEEPPLDEKLHRKPTFINFDKTGPLNQGKTPPSIKRLVKDHQKSPVSTAAKVTTPSPTKSRLLNKAMPAVRTPSTTYGSRSSKSSQGNVPFEEMMEHGDELDQHRTEENDKMDQAPKSTVVLISDDSSQETFSESDDEDFFGDDITTISRQEIGPSTSRTTEPSQRHANEKPLSPGHIRLFTTSNTGTATRHVHVKPLSAHEMEPSTPRNTEPAPRQIHHDPPSPTKAPVETTIVHLGLASSTTNHARRSLEKPLQEASKPLEERRSLSPRAHDTIEDGLHAETGPSLASDSVPALDHGHQNSPSPSRATMMHPVPTPLAMNHAKKSPEKPPLETTKPVNKKRSLDPDFHQVTHSGLSAKAMKQHDAHQSPRKRMKTGNPLSSSHRADTTRLANFMKTTTSASPAQALHRVPPSQRRPARQISDLGSPERLDVRKPRSFTAGEDFQRTQAKVDDSPVSIRTQIASSPTSSHGIMSSNRKKVPDPPLASSKAITSHAPEHMLEHSKLLNTPARPEADPFTSPKTCKGESAFMAMVRERTEAQGTRPVKPELEPQTPGLEALINARSENDPDKTLVNDDEFLDDAFSDTSVASTLDEDEAEGDEDEEPCEKNRHPSEMDWEASLKPHQQNLSFILSRISERLVRHLIDSETAIEDVVAAYEHDGMQLIELMEQVHKEEYQRERGAVTKARTELSSVLERIDGKVRKDKKRYESRNNALNAEAAAPSGALSKTKEQIRALEGILNDLQG